MSFLSSLGSAIGSIGSAVGSAVNWFGGSSTGANVAKTAALALMLKQVTDSNKKSNDRSSASREDRPDYGVREQIDPDTENSIPVVYGEAFLGGVIVDAVLAPDNQTMYYCIALSEKTGVKFSDNQDSVITFEEIYWNSTKIALHSDGIAALSMTDEEGNSSNDISGLVWFYFYNNGSNSPTNLRGYPSQPSPAYSIFPNWTSNHSMSELVFCVVVVRYSREKDITGLGRMEFKLKNTMLQPGDCLHDYMTNKRYGAGIPAEEIA